MEYNFASNSIVDTYIDNNDIKHNVVTGVENVFNVGIDFGDTVEDDYLFIKEFLNKNKAVLITEKMPKYIRKPEIKEVIFNYPATIVKWTDGTKTVVKCQEDDTYSKHVGLAMCITKKVLGNKSNFNNIFTKWCTDEEE